MPKDAKPTISCPSSSPDDSEFEDAEDLEQVKDESTRQQNRLGSGRKFTDTQRIFILMALSEARGRLYIPAEATRITEKIYAEACTILGNNWADKTGLEGRHPNRKSVRTLWKRFITSGELSRKGGGRKKSDIDAELLEILKKEEESNEPFSLRKIASMMPEDRRVSAVTIARRLADLRKPQKGSAQRAENTSRNASTSRRTPIKQQKTKQPKQRKPKLLQHHPQPPQEKVAEYQQSQEQQDQPPCDQQQEQPQFQIEQEQVTFLELSPQKQQHTIEHQHTLNENNHNHQEQHQQLQTTTNCRNTPQLQLQLPTGQNQLRSSNHNSGEFTIQLNFVPDDKLTVVDGK